MQRDDEEIIDKICEYAQEKEIKEILLEYMKRVILAKPDDPLKFLMQQIINNPHIPLKLQDVAEEEN
jgi:hypothetical protein